MAGKALKASGKRVMKYSRDGAVNCSVPKLGNM